ncbi:(4Fe-4S)-binding protein, partial [Roseibium sp. RKSG952]|nr:(4Fe-4S)-binding protein [Roseibium sp. RKSG952]
MAAKLLLCDCAGTQALNSELISSTCGLECSKVHTALCTREIGAAAEFLQQEDGIVVACQQEASVFSELADELGVNQPGFVDLRDRAGWSEEGQDASPKIAALAAEAMLPQP